MNGKIYCEYLNDPNESFVFNSHFEMSGNRKILYPVSCLFFDKFLYSAGGDGKIYKWDIKSKQRLGILLSKDIYIRKFYISDQKYFVLLDDPVSESVSCKLLYQGIDAIYTAK